MTVDLATDYLGLHLRSPLIASSSPRTDDPAWARRADEAGVGAIVLPSLFEEEIVAEEVQLGHALEAGAGQFAEALDYFPAVPELIGVGDRYIDRLERVRGAVSVPVIASLNATTPGSWIRYARRLEDAGADALELNLYHVIADPGLRAEDVEAADVDLVAAVRGAISIPLAVKLGPSYSALPDLVRRVVHAGADGLVLFNRFYQPDLDLEALEVVRRVELSRSWELRLPMRWIALLRPQLGPEVGIAATTGVHTGTDALKALMVGADVAMMTSALLRHGPEHVRVVETELRAWLEEHEYDSVRQLRGSASRTAVADPGAFERADYIATLHSWTTPVDAPT